MSLQIYRRHTKLCTAQRPQHDHKWLQCSCNLYADGRCGKERVRESLRTRDYRGAIQIVQEAESRGFWREPGSGGKHPRKVAEAFTSFLDDAKNPNGRNLRLSTMRKYWTLQKRLIAFCGQMTLEKIEPDLLRKFRDTWKMDARSAAGEMTRIKAFFRYCLESEWITRNPAALVRLPKGKGGDRQKQPFTEEEVERILKAACELFGRGSKTETAILLMSEAGFRISDAVMLQSASLSGDVLAVKTIKSGAKVVIPITGGLVERLNAIEPVNGYYFVEGNPILGTQTDLYRQRFNRCAKKAGVVNATPHRLRHAAAVRFIMAGLSMDTIAEILGHSSSNITKKHYAAFTSARQEALAAQVRKSWDLDKAA